MLPRRNFLQFLGLAAAAPVASAVAPAEASRYGMAYVTGSAALSGADLKASEVSGSMAQMASGHPDMESELARTLDEMRQAKDHSKPLDRRDLASTHFIVSSSAEAANIDALRSVSDAAKISMKRELAEKCARQENQNELQRRIDEMLRDNPTLRASKAFMDYLNDDGK